jgi:hypothetical protein
MRKLFLGLALALTASGFAARASAEATADRAAAQQIAENMKLSGKLRDYRVGVKFQDGVAWLSGTVTSEEQKVLAEQIARQSEGVEAVVSKLEVSSPRGAQPASQRVADAVQPASMESEALPQAPLPQQTAVRPRNNTPLPYARTMQAPVQPMGYGQYAGPAAGGMAPMPMSAAPAAGGQTVSYDNPQLPGYAWPSYAAHPNYAAVSYPQQYSPTAWPYIGPFYPYPQVPLGWRKVTLEWDDGWWWLDFKDCKDCH